MVSRLPLVRVSGRQMQMPSGDALALLAGGTGANDAAGARNNLALKSAALADILGVVTQDSSSALFQRSAASTGTVFRSKSGIQICFSNAMKANTITQTFGALYRSASINWVFPAQFGGEQPPMVFAQDTFEAIWCGCSLGSYTSSSINSIYPTSVNDSRNLFACAIGRWY